MNTKRWRKAAALAVTGLMTLSMGHAAATAAATSPTRSSSTV